MSNEVTRVVFRKWKDDGSITALFPDDPHDYAGLMCTAYSHVGQHGGADYQSCISRTVPATPEEYESLKNELESEPYNYNLRVVKKCSPKHYENARQYRLEANN